MKVRHADNDRVTVQIKRSSVFEPELESLRTDAIDEFFFQSRGEFHEPTPEARIRRETRGSIKRGPWSAWGRETFPRTPSTRRLRILFPAVTTRRENVNFS